MGVSFNKVILAGGMTREPELRYTPSGTAVLDTSIAISEKRKGPSGNYDVEETTYVECTFFGRTAEVIAEYCNKGSQLLIEGRLKLDQWQDKNTGDKRSKLRVIGDKIQMLGGNKGSGHGGGRQQSEDNDAAMNRERDEQVYGQPQEGDSSRDKDEIHF